MRQKTIGVIFLLLFLLVAQATAINWFIRTPPPSIGGGGGGNVSNILSNSSYIITSHILSNYYVGFNDVLLNSTIISLAGAGIAFNYNSFFNQGLNTTSNVSFRSGIFTGNNTPDETIGYANVRLGSIYNSGRIVLEYENGVIDTAWQIDNGGDSIRFFNDTVVFAKVNRTGMHTDYNMSADYVIADFLKGYLAWSYITGAPAFLTAESDPVWVAERANYIPYTGATANVDLNNKSLSNIFILNASKGYFLELNVSNNTIYIGGVKISSLNSTNLEISNGLAAVNASYYFGSGKFLTDLNISVFNGTVSFYGPINMNNQTIFNSSSFNGTYFYGNGTQLLGICLSNGTNCDISSYVPYVGAIKTLNLGAKDLLLNGTIKFDEQSGIVQLLKMNHTGGDGFVMEYWYDFELPNDDWFVLHKTDGNDDTPDGGIAFVMSNATHNWSILKLDGYKIANFTGYNIVTTANVTAGGINLTQGIGSTYIDGRGYIVASDGEAGFFSGDEQRYIGFDTSGNVYNEVMITCYNSSDNTCRFNDNVLVDNDITARNIKVQNLTALDYIIGQPLTGSIGSGIINASSITSRGSLNVSYNGLDVTYPAFTVRLVRTDMSTKYCKIPGATVTVADNAHTVYYVDNNCNVQSTTMAIYAVTDLSPGGIADFFNVMSHSGMIELIKGVTLQQKVEIKLRQLTLRTDHLRVISGLSIVHNLTWRNFTINSGEYQYIREIVPTSKYNVSVEGLEVGYHSGVGTWTYMNQSGLNVTWCDTGTGIAVCTTGTGSNTKYRRHFIFLTGYNASNTQDTTEVVQFLPLLNTFYSSVALCMDTTTYPLTYTIPDEYTYAAVKLYAYCARADDTAWVNNQFIDLRSVKSSTSSGSSSAPSYWTLTDNILTTMTSSYIVRLNELLINNTNAQYNAISAVGNLDNYFQFNIRNTNAGTSASSDVVATSNNGNETSYYIDMGINSNGYTNPAYSITGANDGYLFVQNGSLAIGTASAGKDIKFHTGGTTISNMIANINTTGLYMNNSNISANYFFGNGTQLTGIAVQVGSIDRTGLISAVGATTLYNIPTGKSGLYRLCYVASITTVATTSSTLGGTTGFQMVYTDVDDSQVKTFNEKTPINSTENTVGTSISGCQLGYAKTATNIQYIMGYTSSGATAMAYNLHARLENLG